MTASAQIDTERLVLREPLESDAIQLRDYHVGNAERFDRWEPKRGTEVEAYRRWVEWRRDERGASRGLTFLAFDRAAPGTLVGLVSFDAMTTHPARTAMISYSVDGAYEGRGYARETVGAMIDYGLGALALDAISANYDPANARSGGLLARLGFTVVATTPAIPGAEQFMRAQVLAMLTRPTAPG
ncbi:MAG: GNAT family N-acetyltransferase [Candidatus Eremiobacteraeota bacterium]|nr:GNAT family N-acetyltransferase [Candidatus Eremiobacteraeota bacterium]